MNGGAIAPSQRGRHEARYLNNHQSITTPAPNINPHQPNGKADSNPPPKHRKIKPHPYTGTRLHYGKADSNPPPTKKE